MIYSGIIDFDISKLKSKLKSRQKREKRRRFDIGRSIHERPKGVNSRETFGHWELDTVVSSRGESKGCLATFVERKTRFYLAVPMKDRNKNSMLKAINEIREIIPSSAFKTFTSDRGKEFACYKDVEKSGIDFYFADAYIAWQRGTNENSNGLLREYYPKKTDLAQIDFSKLIKNLNELNDGYRKCLNYKRPFEMFLHELELL